MWATKIDQDNELRERIREIENKLKGLHNYFSGHCEEQSDAAIHYDYMELEIASSTSGGFAMTLWALCKGPLSL